MSSESTSARALASRRNGARSRGPKTAAGKARSSRNALKHGGCAHKVLVLPEEDAGEFRALVEALMHESAPVGALQEMLAQQVAAAAWRLAGADRIEAEVLAERRFADGGLGLAVIRDGNGTRSFDTVLRYRGAALAEFMLRTLEALQAEARGASPPPRRRARLLRAERNEPRQAREINGLTENGAVDRRPDASNPGDPAAPAVPPATATDATPAPRGAMPRRLRHHALHRDRPDLAPAVLSAPPATTERTRESKPKQSLGALEINRLAS